LLKPISLASLRLLLQPLGYDTWENHSEVFMDGSHICAVTINPEYVAEHFNWKITKLTYPLINSQAFNQFFTHRKKFDCFLFNGYNLYNTAFLFNLFSVLPTMSYTLSFLDSDPESGPLFFQSDTLIALAPRVTEDNTPVIPNEHCYDIRTYRYPFQIPLPKRLSRYTL